VTTGMTETSSDVLGFGLQVAFRQLTPCLTSDASASATWRRRPVTD
jgi:hypothetical protein